jgi:hypothetical protein
VWFFCRDQESIRRWRPRQNRRAGFRPARIVLPLGFAGLAVVVATLIPVLDPIATAGDPERAAALAALENDRTIEALPFGAGDSLRLRARDRELDRARAARSLIRPDRASSGGSGDKSLPDPLTARAIAVSIDAYSRALIHESAVLGSEARSFELGARASRFPAIWSETIGEFLEILNDRPALWSKGLPVGEGEVDLPGLLLSLCLLDAYGGDDFALPRECLPLRTATLPESIAACCMDPDRCRDAGSGADCRAFVAGIMAESVDQDAMAGFRYGAAYWALPAGAGPRNADRDGRIAAGSVRFLGELLEASEIDRPDGSRGTREIEPGSNRGSGLGRLQDGEISVQEAIDLLRASGKLWPPSIDPFATVPGLRNPRWGGSGVLRCDVAIYDDALQAVSSRTRAWLLERLGPDRKIIRLDSR